jgi:hypothetical protein
MRSRSIEAHLREHVALAACVLALSAAAGSASAQVPAGAPPTAAAPRPRDARFYLGGGYDLGGDTLVRARLSDGSSPTIDANGGLVLAVGADFLPLAGGRLRTRATLGLKYDWIDASNATVTYLAFPLEAVELVALGPFRVGAGLSLSLRPRLSGSGLASGLDAAFETSLGVVLQAEHEWRFRGAGGGALVVGPRFIWQKLRSEDTGKAFGANALGLYVGWLL